MGTGMDNLWRFPHTAVPAYLPLVTDITGTMIGVVQVHITIPRSDRSVVVKMNWESSRQSAQSTGVHTTLPTPKHIVIDTTLGMIPRTLVDTAAITLRIMTEVASMITPLVRAQTRVQASQPTHRMVDQHPCLSVKTRRNLP